MATVSFDRISCVLYTHRKSLKVSFPNMYFHHFDIVINNPTIIVSKTPKLWG